MENTLVSHVHRIDDKNVQLESALDPDFIGVRVVENLLLSPQPRHHVSPTKAVLPLLNAFIQMQPLGFDAL
jgi:hypothetical protein